MHTFESSDREISRGRHMSMFDGRVAESQLPDLVDTNSYLRGRPGYTWWRVV